MNCCFARRSFLWSERSQLHHVMEEGATGRVPPGTVIHSMREAT